jgi:hypothetical protein
MNLDGLKQDCREAIRKNRGDGYAEMCLRVIDQCQGYKRQLADTKAELEKAQRPGIRTSDTSRGSGFSKSSKKKD